MRRLIKRSERRRSRFVAIALIYLVMLQGVVVTAANVKLVPDAADRWASLELCLHDGGSKDAPVDIPASPSDRHHCILCLVGAAPVLPSQIIALPVHFVDMPAAHWTKDAWPLPAKTVDASARPRGPPHLV